MRLELQEKIDKLKTISQIHSNSVLVINKPSIISSTIQADALITKLPNIILGILTADCVPVLLYDHEDKIIAAVHIGWRGAKNKIIINTLEKMRSIGSNLSNIIAGIGPCIGYNSYEVGEDLLDQFVSENNKSIRYFKKFNKNKYLFNLSGFIASQLLAMKINKNNISISKHDTFKEDNEFFSHRRSLQNNEFNCGRMISTISIIKNTQ